MLVQRRRNKRAALRLMRKLLRKQGFVTKLLTTDKLGSYGSAFRHRRLTCPHEQGLRRTTAPKTPTKSCDDESVKCRGSNEQLVARAARAKVTRQNCGCLAPRFCFRSPDFGPPALGTSAHRAH